MAEEDEAQEVLIQCGAISYGLHELSVRAEQARVKLQTALQLGIQTHWLTEMVEEVIRPVEALLATASAPGSEEAHLLGFGDSGGAAIHPKPHIRH